MKHRGRTCRLLAAAGTEKAVGMILASLKGIQAPEELLFMRAFSMTQIRQRVFPTAGTEPADILVAGFPLKDEAGIDQLVDLAERNSRLQILLLVPQETFDQVSYRCRNLKIFVLSLPVRRQVLTEAVQFMLAVRRQLDRQEEELLRLRKNLSEIGLITRAKCILVREKDMEEKEAHYYLEKEAMDRHLSKKEVAEEIIRRASASKTC